MFGIDGEGGGEEEDEWHQRKALLGGYGVNKSGGANQVHAFLRERLLQEDVFLLVGEGDVVVEFHYSASTISEQPPMRRTARCGLSVKASLRKGLMNLPRKVLLGRSQ